MATNEIVVTQEDRQAAVDAITDWQTIPFGFVDELAERFARHRIRARIAIVSEIDRRLSAIRSMKDEGR